LTVATLPHEFARFLIAPCVLNIQHRSRLMNIKNANEVRDKLREQQRKLLDAIRTHLSLSGSDSLYTLPNAHDATDDDAIADVIAESDVATLGAELAELREILRAKRRIAEGSYGKCIDCGGAISRRI
jgi:RNA polymerase-binding transcription factor DksA